MAVSKRIRYEVMRRDGHACRYCGAMAPDVKLTIDHVMPVALGGDDAPSNLVTACADCNSGKTSSAPDAALVADVAEADIRLAEAMKRASEEIVAKADSESCREYVFVFKHMWDEFACAKGSLPLPDNWMTSVANFAKQGLPEELLADALYIAMNNKKIPNEQVFRYMCGICWRRVREIQERAAEIMAEEGVEA